jgi:hypothetical protein
MKGTIASIIVAVCIFLSVWLTIGFINVAFADSILVKSDGSWVKDTVITSDFMPTPPKDLKSSHDQELSPRKFTHLKVRRLKKQLPEYVS